MDAFENVIASILQRRGYWTMTSVKVELTKAEKRAIGRPSAPRWELDIVPIAAGVMNSLSWSASRSSIRRVSRWAPSTEGSPGLLEVQAVQRCQAPAKGSESLDAATCRCGFLSRCAQGAVGLGRRPHQWG